MNNSAKLLMGLSLVAGSFVALMATAPVQAQGQANQDPNSVCLSTDDIKGTQAKDSRTILFTMRDGSVWQNTLAAACPTLVSTGSVWTQNVHGDRICANKQQITLVQTGIVCRLGTFTRVK